MDEYAIPPADTSRGMKGNKKPSWCCGPNWQLTAIFWVVLIGTSTLVGLVIGFVSKSDELNQTTRATVSMHDETTQMRKNVEDMVNKLRAHFPANQGEVTLEQITDSIHKVHGITMWVDKVLADLPPNTLEKLVKNADSLVGNATSIVAAVQTLFDGSTTGEAGARHRAMVGNAAMFFAKGAELLSTVSPGEFHAAFASGHEALQAMAKLSQNISQERVNRIVESASDILGAAEATHIVGVISELVKGASDVIHRFAQPGGIRLSLPLSGEAKK